MCSEVICVGVSCVLLGDLIKYGDILNISVHMFIELNVKNRTEQIEKKNKNDMRKVILMESKKKEC